MSKNYLVMYEYWCDVNDRWVPGSYKTEDEKAYLKTLEALRKEEVAYRVRDIVVLEN